MIYAGKMNSNSWAHPLKKKKKVKTTLVFYLKVVNEHVFIGFRLIEKLFFFFCLLSFFLGPHSAAQGGSQARGCHQPMPEPQQCQI